jgi:repressor LexA
MIGRQREILNFIGEFIDAQGYSPSFQDIADHTSLKSLATVSKHIDNLIAQGKIVKKANAARSLELTDSVSESRFKFIGRGEKKLYDTISKTYWTRK